MQQKVLKGNTVATIAPIPEVTNVDFISSDRGDNSEWRVCKIVNSDEWENSEAQGQWLDLVESENQHISVDRRRFYIDHFGYGSGLIELRHAWYVVIHSK